MNTTTVAPGGRWGRSGPYWMGVETFRDMAPAQKHLARVTKKDASQISRELNGERNCPVGQTIELIHEGAVLGLVEVDRLLARMWVTRRKALLELTPSQIRERFRTMLVREEEMEGHENEVGKRYLLGDATPGELLKALWDEFHATLALITYIEVANENGVDLR